MYVCFYWFMYYNFFIGRGICYEWYANKQLFIWQFCQKIWPHYEMTLKKVRTRKSYFKYISDICNYLKKDFTAIDESEAQNYFSQLAETKATSQNISICVWVPADQLLPILRKTHSILILRTILVHLFLLIFRNTRIISINQIFHL